MFGRVDLAWNWRADAVERAPSSSSLRVWREAGRGERWTGFGGARMARARGGPAPDAKSDRWHARIAAAPARGSARAPILCVVACACTAVGTGTGTGTVVDSCSTWGGQTYFIDIPFKLNAIDSRFPAFLAAMFDLRHFWRTCTAKSFLKMSDELKGCGGVTRARQDANPGFPRPQRPGPFHLSPLDAVP